MDQRSTLGQQRHVWRRQGVYAYSTLTRAVAHTKSKRNRQQSTNCASKFTPSEIVRVVLTRARCSCGVRLTAGAGVAATGAGVAGVGRGAFGCSRTQPTHDDSPQLA
eukprot:4514454-Pyramimonas_sp.AAC.1